MSVPQKCALWKDWWDYLKKDELPLKLQVNDIICKVEIDVLWAIAKQVTIDFWCWSHDRKVYPQRRIDNDILVLIADKLSEYAKNQLWGEVNDLSEDVWIIIEHAYRFG